MPENAAPRVSVVMPTRDRPDQIDRALQAVMSNTLTDFELVLVDQGSRDKAAADIAEQLGKSDPRIRAVRDTGVGASRARNLGAAASSAEIIVFIDDDCEADADWLQSFVSAFDEHPDAGIACGKVTPAPSDPRQGFIVGYLPPKRRRLTGRLGKLLDSGISANMAFRRTAFEEIGGFDEMLGPGAYFVAMEDQEATYRVLRAGYSLLHVPEANVVHHGLRDWASGSRLIRRTYVAIAAAYMKHARLGDPIGALLLLQQLWLATVNLVEHVIQRRRPLGIGRLAALLVGARRSFDLDVDAGRVLYRPRLQRR
jgi:GT2 family glycosyltransferase